MRVLRTVAGGLLAVGFLIGAAPTSLAQQQPPKLDVDKATAALADADQQIYRAPGAVAYFDEDKVRAKLTKNVKILVAPYTGDNYKDDEHLTEVYDPLEAWTKKHKINLVMVEGIYVTAYAEKGYGYGPGNIPELRQTTAYLDVTAAIVSSIRSMTGMDPEKAGQHGVGAPIPPVAPTREQLDDLAGNLRDNPVYNAPGREDPVDGELVGKLAKELGRTVRVAAFPIAEPGKPIVDYAPALAKVFPDDIVMVSTGRWLDIAAAQQDKANSARDYAYGRYEIGSFTRGSTMTDRIGTVLQRLDALLQENAYGRPQPAPQPPLQPFDVRRTIAAFAPWVLVGSAVVIGGTGLVAYRRHTAARDKAEAAAMRRASAAAMAKIGELGARLLDVEEKGETANPAAAERHATARTLYDQALTAKAMAEVEKIAEEGLALPKRVGKRRSES